MKCAFQRLFSIQDPCMISYQSILPISQVCVNYVQAQFIIRMKYQCRSNILELVQINVFTVIISTLAKLTPYIRHLSSRFHEKVPVFYIITIRKSCL